MTPNLSTLIKPGGQPNRQRVRIRQLSFGLAFWPSAWQSSLRFHYPPSANFSKKRLVQYADGFRVTIDAPESRWQKQG